MLPTILAIRMVFSSSTDMAGKSVLASSLFY